MSVDAGKMTDGGFSIFSLSNVMGKITQALKV